MLESQAAAYRKELVICSMTQNNWSGSNEKRLFFFLKMAIHNSQEVFKKILRPTLCLEKQLLD